MNWWTDLFDETIADLFLDRDSAMTLTHQVDFLEAVLMIEPGDLVFDQCCGTGSLSMPLAAHGKRVVGVDNNHAYIDKAKRRAQVADLDCQFFQGDAFDFMPEHNCDAAFNWGNSFGNTPSDKENKRVLARAFECLKSGGRYLVDFPNMAHLLMNFQECMVRHKGDTMVVRESELDIRDGNLKHLWTIITPEGTQQRPSQFRLYMPHDLERMMSSVGFRDVALYGDLNGDLLEETHARCLVLGTKP